MEVWPFPHNWRETLSLHYGMFTDVLVAENGQEKRRSIRTIPRMVLTYQMSAHHPQEAGAQDAHLRTGLGQTFYVPLWPHQTFLDAAVVAGATSIPLQTAGRRYQAPGKALIWMDWKTWELLDVSAVAAGSLTVTAIAADWPSTALVFPIMEGVLREAVEIDRPSAESSEVEVTFDLYTVLTYGITGESGEL